LRRFAATAAGRVRKVSIANSLESREHSRGYGAPSKARLSRQEARFVQIIIVHPRLPEARTLTITPRLAAGVIAAIGAALILGAVLLNYAASGIAWPQAATAGQPERNREEVRQQAMLRENINLLAKRVGEMQAKLMQLD